jgi:uncharacterized protein YjfI (DUF2170 family)
MKKLLIIISVITISLNADSQINAKTEDGKMVLLYEDNSWEYVSDTKEAKESTLIVEPNELSCETLIETTEDKMTGKKTTSAKESLIISKDGKNGFGIFIMKSGKSIIMSTSVVGSGSCIEDDAIANILFRDGSKLQLTNSGKFNCKGKFTLYMGGGLGNKKALKELKAKEIETLRIWTNKSYVQEDFAAEQSQSLLTILNCLN